MKTKKMLAVVTLSAFLSFGGLALGEVTSSSPSTEVLQNIKKIRKIRPRRHRRRERLG